jgi:hypothetical protein
MNTNRLPPRCHAAHHTGGRQLQKPEKALCHQRAVNLTQHNTVVRRIAKSTKSRRRVTVEPAEIPCSLTGSEAEAANWETLDNLEDLDDGCSMRKIFKLMLKHWNGRSLSSNPAVYSINITINYIA